MFPFYTTLKTPENLWFFGVFRGYKMGTLARNGLIKSVLKKDTICVIEVGRFKNEIIIASQGSSP